MIAKVLVSGRSPVGLGPVGPLDLAGRGEGHVWLHVDVEGRALHSHDAGTCRQAASRGETLVTAAAWLTGPPSHPSALSLLSVVV